MKSIIVSFMQKKKRKSPETQLQLKKACESGNYVDIGKILDSGADVNIIDSDNQTALFWALTCVDSTNRNLTIQHLLSVGADVNLQDSVGSTPLMKCSYLGYHDTCKQMLPYAQLNIRDCEGQTALVHAVESRCLEIVRLLLECGCDANIMTKHGSNAILIAAESGWVDGITTLVSSSSRPLLFAVDSRHRSALHLAILGGHVDASLYLLQCCNFCWDDRDADGFSPLYLAGWEPHVESGRMFSVFKALAEKGADLNINPPHQCALLVRVWDKPEYVRILVCNGADVNISTGSHINCLLEWAVLGMQLDMAYFLLRAGASSQTLMHKCHCALHKVRQTQLRQLMASLPLSLIHLTRIAIRHHCHRPFSQTLPRLPLPTTLLTYLSMTAE
jgi:ankyrin repeat protein